METDIEIEVYKDAYSKYWKAEDGQIWGNKYKYNPFNGMINVMFPYLNGKKHGKVYMVQESVSCFLNYNHDKSSGMLMSYSYNNGKLMKEKILYKDEIVIKRTFYY